MTKLPIGKLGRLLSGADVGKFVKFVDDSDNTGGYLILTSKDASHTAWFDSWVASEEDLEKYVRESNWLIEWLE